MRTVVQVSTHCGVKIDALWYGFRPFFPYKKGHKKTFDDVSKVISCGTRTRTLNNRTRICCVANYTIPQSLVASADIPCLAKCGAKVDVFFGPTK